MGKRKNGEGSYGEKTIKGVVYKYYRDASGKYIYAKTAKELKEKIEQNKQKKNEVSSITIFGDYCYYWLKEHYSEISSGTYDDYENIIKSRIITYPISKLQISAITPESLNKYFLSLAKKYSKASIDKTWCVIRQVLEYGMEEKEINEFSISKIKRPKEQNVAVKKKEVPFIDEEDMEELYNTVYNGNYDNSAYMLIFIMYSGLRVSEAIALTWKCVSKDFSQITVRKSTRRIVERDDNLNPIQNINGTSKYVTIQKETKTIDGTRTIPIPQRAIDILKHFYSQYSHGANDFVFVTSNNTQYNKRNVERTLEKILQDSNCSRKDYTPHCLRHGYGSILVKNGVDIKLVSELLGHSKVDITYNYYIGFKQDDKISAVNKVFK